MKRVAFSIIAVCLLASASVFAQTSATQPGALPKVMRIYREEVKPAMPAAHAKIEAGWPKAFAKAGTTNYYLALRSFSGVNEALFVEPYDSYSSMEKADAEIEKNALLTAELSKLAEEDSRVLSGARTLILSLNDELSRPGSSQIATMRYFAITTWRVRPGRGADFVEARKLVKSAQESGKSNIYYATYFVASGAPQGTYMQIRSLKSLSELDPGPSAQTLAQVLGEDKFKRYNELLRDSLISSEIAIFSFSPEMSYLSKEAIAVDPAFWAPKPKPASKSSTKKEAKATAPAQ